MNTELSNDEPVADGYRLIMDYDIKILCELDKSFV